MTRDELESVRSALGIHRAVRVWVGGHNLATKRLVEPFLTDTTRPPTGPVDIALIAPESADEAAYFLGKIAVRLEHDRTAWIIQPPTAVAIDHVEHALDAAPARHSDKLARVPGGSVALPDGFRAHAFCFRGPQGCRGDEPAGGH